MDENRFAARARSLVGCRFRPQGRDVTTGVDCIGLALHAFALPSDLFPRDYRLRGDHGARLRAAMQPLFRRVARTQCRPGDLMLLKVASDQWHLAVRSAAGFIHAEAGLGRVVETPGAPPWPLAAVFRRRVRPIRSR